MLNSLIFILFFILFLSGPSCGGQAGAGSALAEPCSLAIAYAGPTQAGAFAGLGEDAAACAMASWRERFVQEEPDASAIFVSSACGQGADGTLDKPFCTIADALPRAAELAAQEVTPELHIDPGSHAMNLTLKAELPSLKIRGLCSETTAIAPADDALPLVRQDASAAVALRIQGVALHAGAAAAIRLDNGSIELEGVQVVQGANNDCFDVVGASSSLSGTSVLIVGSAAAASFSAPAVVDGGSLLPIVGTRDLEKCITVEQGGALVLEGFSISGLREVGIHVTGAGSRATLTDGVVSGILTNATSGGFGYGLAVEDGASAAIDQVTFTGNHGANVLADGDGTSVTLQRSYLGEAGTNIVNGAGVGLMLQRGATGTLTGVNVKDNASAGVVASSGASLSMSDSILAGNAFSNVVITNANGILTGNDIGAAAPSSAFGGIVGLFLQSRNSTTPTVADVSGNVIAGNQGSGVYAIDYAAAEMDVSLTGNFLSGNASLDVPYNPHLFAYGVEGSLEVQGNCIESLGAQAPAAGIDDSAIAMTGNIASGTYDGYVVHQQSCADPTADAVDPSAQTLPLGAVSCICNEVSLTGAPCANFETAPTLYFGFGIEEEGIL